LSINTAKSVPILLKLPAKKIFSIIRVVKGCHGVKMESLTADHISSVTDLTERVNNAITLKIGIKTPPNAQWLRYHAKPDSASILIFKGASSRKLKCSRTNVYAPLSIRGMPCP
jgi:hypothetical protein